MYIGPYIIENILIPEQQYTMLVRQVNVPCFVFGHTIEHVGGTIYANTHGAIEMPEIAALRIPFIDTALVYRDHLACGISCNGRNIDIGILGLLSS